MIAARDIRGQFDEVRRIKAAFSELKVGTFNADFTALKRDERQAVLVWLDEYLETKTAPAPLAQVFGKTARVGERWSESLFQTIMRNGWTSVFMHQKRPLPEKVVLAVRRRSEIPAHEIVQRIVTIDAILLEQKRPLTRSFHVLASGAWWVDGERIQSTNVSRSLASFVMGFERERV